MNFIRNTYEDQEKKRQTEKVELILNVDDEDVISARKKNDKLRKNFNRYQTKMTGNNNMKLKKLWNYEKISLSKFRRTKPTT